MKKFTKKINVFNAYKDFYIKKVSNFRAYNTAKEILAANIDKLHIVAGILLEKEKIDGEEFDRVFNS